MQVPLRLYTLFAALYPSNPRLGPVFTTAFYRSLTLSHAHPDETTRQLSAGGSLHRTAAALRQQVAASGLLLPPHLPHLLAAAADELLVGRVHFGTRSHPGSCPAGCSNAPSGPTSSSSSSTSGGGGQQGGSGRRGVVTRRGLASLAACRCRADFATECLQVLLCLKLVWKHTSSGRERGEVLPAAVYAAAMQLVLACFRRSSDIIEQLPPDWVMASRSLEVSFSSCV
jgi:hypothetical protein